MHFSQEVKLKKKFGRSTPRIKTHFSPFSGKLKKTENFPYLNPPSDENPVRAPAHSTHRHDSCIYTKTCWRLGLYHAPMLHMMVIHLQLYTHQIVILRPRIWVRTVLRLAKKLTVKIIL